MRHFKVLIIVVFLLSAMALWVGCQEAKSSKSKAHPKETTQTNHPVIDSLMQICYARKVFNGNILVIKNKETIYQNELGFLEGTKSQKLAPNTIFNIGSIAKEFSAVAIMMLYEKGLLQLEDSLATFDLGLPPWAKKVKVKHLLNYTSGLPKVRISQVKHSLDILQGLRKLTKLNFEPGTAYNYNHHSVFLQKRIVEKITKAPFAQFVQSQMLAPLGMKNSLIDPRSDVPGLAKSFDNEGKNDPEDPGILSGWVYPTVEDLAKWMDALHTGKLISPQSLRTLLTPFSPSSQAALGQGKFIDDRLHLHQHQGSSYNFESLVYYDIKKQLLIILATNNKNFKLHEIAQSINQITQNKPFSIPKKSVYLTIRQKCYQDIEAGIQYYQDLKKNHADQYNFEDESELNQLGYKLLRRKQVKAAIKIFQLLVQEFPEAANPYDSLGEAYLLDKQYKQALKNYQKAFELNPKNKHAKKMIQRLQNL